MMSLYVLLTWDSQMVYHWDIIYISYLCDQMWLVGMLTMYLIEKLDTNYNVFLIANYLSITRTCLKFYTMKLIILFSSRCVLCNELIFIKIFPKNDLQQV